MSLCTIQHMMKPLEEARTDEASWMRGGSPQDHKKKVQLPQLNLLYLNMEVKLHSCSVLLQVESGH